MPPNLTFIIQPCDARIIIVFNVYIYVKKFEQLKKESFKYGNYKRNLVHYYIKTIDEKKRLSRWDAPSSYLVPFLKFFTPFSYKVRRWCIKFSKQKKIY